jgi:hypothetical protein
MTEPQSTPAPTTTVGVVDERPDRDAWRPAIVRDEAGWDERLRDDVRPLMDSLQRLRERGLLD